MSDFKNPFILASIDAETGMGEKCPTCGVLPWGQWEARANARMEHIFVEVLSLTLGDDPVISYDRAAEILDMPLADLRDLHRRHAAGEEVGWAAFQGRFRSRVVERQLLHRLLDEEKLRDACALCSRRKTFFAARAEIRKAEIALSKLPESDERRDLYLELENAKSDYKKSNYQGAAAKAADVCLCALDLHDGALT